MNNFTRTGDSKKSLDVGNNHTYKEMWLSEMEDLYTAIAGWSEENGIDYKWSLMDFATGDFNWYNADFENQNPEIVFTMPLESLIKVLKSWREKKDEKHSQMAKAYRKQSPFNPSKPNTYDILEEQRKAEIYAAEKEKDMELMKDLFRISNESPMK